MSSVTISTTVWPVDQPCSSTVGVKTRTLAVPCGRCAASWRCAERRAREIDRVARREVLERRRAGSSGPGTARRLVAELAGLRGCLRRPLDDLAAVALLSLRHRRLGSADRRRHALRTVLYRDPTPSPCTLDPGPAPRVFTGSPRPSPPVEVQCDSLRRCSYDADPAAVFAMLTQAEFQERKCAATGALDARGRQVERVRRRERRRSAPAGDAHRPGARLRRARSSATTLEVVAGRRLAAAPAADGVRDGTAVVEIKGAPVRLAGRHDAASPAAAGRVETIDGDAQGRRCPLVGGQIEKAARAGDAGGHQGRAARQRWLAGLSSRRHGRPRRRSG